MGREMKPMTFWEMVTTIMATTAMAIAELIRRLRRSTRCSKNDILPPASCSGGVSDGSDGEVVIRRFPLGWGRGVRRNRRRGRVRAKRLLDCGCGLHLESGRIDSWRGSLSGWPRTRARSFWFYARGYHRGCLHRGVFRL